MTSLKEKKRIYVVRRRFRIYATVGIMTLLLLYSILVMYTLLKGSRRFALQIVQLSAIKNYEIKSKTMAELKQTELSMNNLALYSAS